MMRTPLITFLVSLCLLAACSRGAAPEQTDPLTPVAVFQRPATASAPAVVIQRELLYDQHTLADSFSYNGKPRAFHWEKMQAMLAALDSMQQRPTRWAILQNRNNRNGLAPLSREFTRNAYNNIQDTFGVERIFSSPLFLSPDSLFPARYAHDGMLVKIRDYTANDSMARVESFHLDGEWYVPKQYVKKAGSGTSFFRHAIFVDRRDQTITTLEKSDGKWLVRSMNPATTGLHRPPYQRETPLGAFVIQEKKEKMFFLKDGTNEVEGFAPFANRICNGAYIHGVPVNYPRQELIEFIWTLGTTPRSHMCVRNATSHAKFIFEWGPVERTVVFIFE